MPTFGLQRVFSSDDVFPTSFGRHWGWNGDIWLTLFAPGSIPSWIPQQDQGWVVEMSQPQPEPLDAVALTDPDSDGVFTDADKARVRDLRFYNASNQAVTLPSQATTAVLTRFTGERLTFELYSESSIGGQLTGRITSLTDRNGEQITWTWKYAVNDTSLTGSLRTKLAILDHVTDAYGQTTTFIYDEAAQHSGCWVVTRINFPNGQHVEYTYGNFLDPFGETISALVGVLHPDGSQSTFSSEVDTATSCLRWHCTDPAAEPESRVKTNLFSMILWTNPANSADVRPQVWGRLRESRNALGEQVYASCFKEFTLPDTTAVTHSYIVDHGKLFGIEHLGGDFIRGVYYREDFTGGDMLSWFTASWTGWVLDGSYTHTGPHGSVSSTTDPHGHTTSWVRDATTTATTQTTFPDATTETTTYNGFLEPLQVTDRLGRVTTSTYDSHGNRLTMTRAVGTGVEATWSWEYNARGLMTAAIDADGHRTTCTYTTAGYLATVVAPGDRTGDSTNVTQYTYDSAGRRTSMTDAAGRVYTYSYDSRNRLVDTTFPDTSHETTTFGAANSGNDNLVLARVDRDGRRTEFQYDAAGRRTATIDAAGSGVAMTTSVTYRSGTSEPLAQTRAGDVTEYGYDARMRLISTTRHTRGSAALTDSMVYDAASLVTMTTDPYGRRTARVYDINHRLTRTVSELIPNGFGSSNPATLTRVLTANPDYVIADMTYNAEGELTARTDARGNVTAFSYDAQGRQTSQTEAYGTSEAAVSTTTYDPQGNVTTRRSPRQTVNSLLGASAWTYTARNLVATQVEASGTGLAATTTFTYTPTGKVATRTDANGHVTVNGYCSCCDRLETITDPNNGVTTIAYSFAGDVTSRTDPNG
ncbi:MAG: RHS repeat protein, partial [Planctomycetes bacterium]|nr:RHS repeat protein [Planctomycetota bacterium]